MKCVQVDDSLRKISLFQRKLEIPSNKGGLILSDNDIFALKYFPFFVEDFLVATAQPNYIRGGNVGIFEFVCRERA